MIVRRFIKPDVQASRSDREKTLLADLVLFTGEVELSAGHQQRDVKRAVSMRVLESKVDVVGSAKKKSAS